MTVEPPELRIERLLLRPFRLGDADDVLAYANDEEWSRYVFSSLPYAYTLRDAEEFIAGRVLAPWAENPMFAIALDETVIGAVELRVDVSNLTAELGYSIGRAHWSKGITTEATRAIIDYGFQTLGLEKVFARADERNVASWRVMEKLTMSREGLLRSHGVARDTAR